MLRRIVNWILVKLGLRRKPSDMGPIDILGDLLTIVSAFLIAIGAYRVLGISVPIPWRERVLYSMSIFFRRIWHLIIGCWLLSTVPGHVSQSQLDMWQKCPRQWEYRYVKGLKSRPSGALIEGSCYHKSLEINFAQKKITFNDLPVDDCLDAFSTEWSKVLSKSEDVDWRDMRPEEVKNEGHSLVRTYIQTTAPVVYPIEIEEWYVSEVADVVFVMRIDLVNDVGAVVDHKTSSKSYNQADVDRDMQASAAAFSLERPIIFENHIAVKSSNPKIQIIRTVRSREDIKWWLEASSAIVQQMKTGIAPPRPTGWWCSPVWCGYYELCRGGLIRGYW